MSAVIRPSLAASRTLREATHRLGESSRSFYAPFAALHSPSILPSRPPQPVLRTRTPHRRQPASSSVRYATTLASSSSATPAPLLSSKPKVRVTPPSLERIKADGFFDDDVQLIAEDQAVMHMSPEAVTQLATITSREPPDVLAKGKLALRIMVESGGCHGYQDTLSLTEERNVDDYTFQPEGVNCIPVVVDLVSLNLLKGSRLHFATELIGSSFRIEENPQAKDGGCGCGVSWSLS
ncbi:uncharacterized protein MKK02DRAFT_39197 [Dioszegia hungarica]|uniref:FeS cluster biogenesis domain-containing protein n=1 Tax=Dioszegia hungarica TaxID=4972 RepID=A0AA38H3B8_9TREE|nr:uncharacterized protein MKK02DRAFT_39197 [Dioszegia hungarica]KAI9633217.1 hypothetical protein MKK02DRAFT_39197 [Dioszegia hungarica]